MLIVQKYGGTSVGSKDRIKHVANRIINTKKQNHSVVVVVSAMGKETDNLLNLIDSFSKSPTLREVDMVLSTGEIISSALLSITLNDLGCKAIALSGREAGIITNLEHTKAKIESIEISNIMKYLDDDYVVIVAGFQGINKNGHITTLGRGGSDLSAVALAGALASPLCEIYTDVDGVFTTDPRIESSAKKIDVLSYEEMLELSASGAKILLTRSVELAKKLNVKIITRNSFNDKEGTLITNEELVLEKPIISGVALDKDQARISLVDIIDKPGVAARIFNSLANIDINVDIIVQTVGRDSTTDIDFTVPKADLSSCKEVLSNFKDYTSSMEFDENVAKVSIIGIGMKSHSGIASKAFSALGKENINIRMISTSEIKISMIIDTKYAELAVRTLHSAFELDK